MRKQLVDCKNFFLLAVMTTLSGQSLAQQFKLNDVKGTSGAGSKELKDLTAKGADTAQSIADFLIIGFTLVGLFLVGVSLWALYKANRDDRESPKGAIWGLIVGVLMTAVTLLLGIGRNTINL